MPLLTTPPAPGRSGRLGWLGCGLAAAQPVEFITGAILDPQKEVKEGYLSISVVTKDGEEYQGRQIRETGDELVLSDVKGPVNVEVSAEVKRPQFDDGFGH